MLAIFYSPVRNELRSPRTCTSSSKINYFFFLTVPSSAPWGTRAAAPELCAAPSLLPSPSSSLSLLSR
jgi:hypothetical protein